MILIGGHKTRISITTDISCCFFYIIEHYTTILNQYFLFCCFHARRSFVFRNSSIFSLTRRRCFFICYCSDELQKTGLNTRRIIMRPPRSPLLGRNEYNAIGYNNMILFCLNGEKTLIKNLTNAHAMRVCVYK